jgi:hypothetical protein
MIAKNATSRGPLGSRASTAFKRARAWSGLTTLRRSISLDVLGALHFSARIGFEAVYVWCPRDIAERRLMARNPEDVADRIRAWDQTPPFEDAVLTINTSDTAPNTAAEEIRGLP